MYYCATSDNFTVCYSLPCDIHKNLLYASEDCNFLLHWIFAFSNLGNKRIVKKLYYCGILLTQDSWLRLVFGFVGIYIIFKSHF